MQGGVLSGTVFDSTSGRALRLAQVQITASSGTNVGRSFGAVSDSAGRYELRGVAAGSYLAGFNHPLLDSLGIEIDPVRVDILETTQRLDLATPSARTLRRSICAASGADSGSLLIVGTVRSAESDSTAGNSSIEAWLSDGTGRQLGTRIARVGTAPDGWFALCGLPLGEVVLIRASTASGVSGIIAVAENNLGFVHLPLTVGTARRVPASSAGNGVDVNAADSVWRGEAVLRGLVTGEMGQPVANARVEVRGTGLTTTTNSSGLFALSGLPPGTQLIEVRAIGREPVQALLQLATTRSNTVDISMDRRPVTLAGVEVLSSRVTTNLERFDYRRRTSASGYFVRPEEIPVSVKDQSMAKILNGIPGVTVTCVGAFSCGVSMRRPSSRVTNRGMEQCVPSLYVDGILDRVGDFDLYASREIVAVEVYPREIGRPPEFTDLTRNCGSVVFWTKRR